MSAHADAHTHTCTKCAHPHLPHKGCTHLLGPCRSHALTYALRCLHPLPHSKNVPQFSLYKLSPPHRPTRVEVQRLTHTHIRTPSRKPYLGKRKESHRRQHARVLPPQKACDPYAGLHTHVHSHARQPLPRFWYSLSNLLQARRPRL